MTYDRTIIRCIGPTRPPKWALGAHLGWPRYNRYQLEPGLDDQSQPTKYQITHAIMIIHCLRPTRLPKSSLNWPIRGGGGLVGTGQQIILLWHVYSRRCDWAFNANYIKPEANMSKIYILVPGSFVYGPMLFLKFSINVLV